MKITKSKDGTRLAYDVFGQGPALVYVTGATCFRQFFPIVKDARIFAEKFKVYTYDRRGRGDSEDTQPYSIEREIEDLEAIIDAAGGSAFVYGHSSGAVLALEAALRIPHKIAKVFLYDAAYLHREEDREQYAGLEQEVSNLLRQRKNGQAVKRFLIGIGMPKAFAYLLPLMPGWKQIKGLAPTLMYDIGLTRDLPPLDRAKQVKIPIQITYGEKSPESMHGVSNQLAKAIPGSILFQVPKQDHMVDAKILLPILSKFFEV